MRARHRLLLDHAAVPAAQTRMPGTVIELERLTGDLLRFVLAKPPGFTFLPGDSVRLEVEGVRRRYSILSAPHEPHLEFFVELVPGGRMSAHFRTLRQGSRLTIAAEARKGLRLDGAARRHLMLATVTGINPFVSILRDAVHRGRRGLGCVVIHGASYHDEFGYRAELRALAETRPDLLFYVPTVSRPEEERNRLWRGATGRVEMQVDALRTRFDLTPADTAVYACGNPGMIDGVRQKFEGLGYRFYEEAYK